MDLLLLPLRGLLLLIIKRKNLEVPFFPHQSPADVASPGLTFSSLPKYLIYFIKSRNFRITLIECNLRAFHMIPKFLTEAKEIGIDPSDLIKPFPLILDSLRRKAREKTVDILLGISFNVVGIRLLDLFLALRCLGGRVNLRGRRTRIRLDGLAGQAGLKGPVR